MPSLPPSSIQSTAPDAARAPTPVAFCITELDPGGAEKALVELVTRLDRREWSPHVACLGPAGELIQPLERAGIPVTSFGARRSSDVSVAISLWRWLRRVRPRILQTWLYHANIAGRVVGRLAGVPHIVAGIRVAERRSRGRLRLDRWTAGLVERHVCVSRATAEFSIREGGLPRDRVVVIPNGVDFERFARAAPANLTSLGIPPQSPTILFVGRLERQKNPELFVEAAARVCESHPHVHCLMAGDGPLRASLAEQIARRGLASRIHLLGRRTDVPELMRAATCLVLTSEWEGMPNVVLEAMASGLPVISTDVEGIDDLIVSGKTGVIVPQGAAGLLHREITETLDAPRRARELGTAAQELVRERFTWDVMAATYASLYRAILSPQSARLD